MPRGIPKRDTLDGVGPLTTIPPEELEATLAMLRESLEQLKPRFEGLGDFSRLNLSSASHTAVSEATEAIQRRMQLLEVAIMALQALVDDGYPSLPAAQVTDTILADLQDQLTSLQAAIEGFEPLPEAESIQIEESPDQPQQP